jgi:predicted AlkP superfamily pyrophosphatase or phosphodiesterase
MGPGDKLQLAPTTVIAMRSILLVVLGAFLLAGCAGVQPAPSPPAPGLADGSRGGNLPQHWEAPYVILVSFDGFRHDYQERVDTPNFDRVSAGGVTAEGLIPVFPSKTFPNHYTIVTGMYADAHGIVSNSFFEPERGEQYSIGIRETVEDGTWYRGEPIWVTAERQGMVAASYFWVGSEADIQGIQPTIWKPYDGSVPNAARVDSVLAWLRLPAHQRPHVVTLYFSDVDDAGHRHGPFAPEVDHAVASVDSALGRLLDGIEALPIRDQVYVLLVSDHGMAAAGPETAVAFESFIDMEGIVVGDSGPAANLHVEGGPARARQVRDALNAGLEHGRAYLRADVPRHLHYRADPRIGDVVVLMDEHYQIRPQDRMPRSAGGTHGWDPTLPSMHGIFLAMGPGIRPGARIPAFEAVHIYPLLTEILGLTPGPDVQGRPGWLRGLIGAE